MLSSKAGIALVLAASLLLVALGWWTYRAVENSLREIRANTLAAELDAEVRALRAAIGAAQRDRGVPVDPAEFADALTGASIGDQGEVFALDLRGVMQSESRFTQDMVGHGLLPPGARSRGTLELREPGGAHPLTRLAERAIASASAPEPAGRRGTLLDPYPNHRGLSVIGAWRWLPEYGIAIAVEIEAEQAYAPLRFLRIAFGAVFGALVLAVTAALASGLSVLRLRQQVGEAKRLGAYTLERRIGEGGMANVYLAQHALLKRPTAVKILKPHRASDEWIARFEREVRLASQLRHPNTVQIYDYGRTADGLFYYAMEYLVGITLAEMVQLSGAAPVSRVVYLLRQVCAGLAEAHANGLVHRDVKPENVMACSRGGEFDVVKILDFGLVKSVVEPHSRDLTRSLRILGTPLYMAPERIRNPADVDARADIYALGAVAFYLLTGSKLFEASDDLTLSNSVLNEEAPRPSTRAAQEIPFELDLLVTACLEKKREDRPQRITDLIETFDALAAEHRWTQKDAAEWWEKYCPAA